MKINNSEQIWNIEIHELTVLEISDAGGINNASTNIVLVGQMLLFKFTDEYSELANPGPMCSLFTV